MDDYHKYCKCIPIITEIIETKATKSGAKRYRESIEITIRHNHQKEDLQNRMILIYGQTLVLEGKEEKNN